MKWANIQLIFQRELRDQLRDRRTLFMIAVLPILLYPFLGMSFVRVSQFMQEHPTRIWLVGTSALPEDPPLVVDGGFSNEFCSGAEGRLLSLRLSEALPADDAEEGPQATAQRLIESGEYDAIVYFPPNFADELQKSREQLLRSRDSNGEEAVVPGSNVPQPMIFYAQANDKSAMAYTRVAQVLNRWRDAIVRQTLQENRIPVSATQPFQLDNADISKESSRRAAAWSKILPFVVLIWALTGAFYPAIDLCAGEKERGTLETLLSSPAQRGEVVWGKLLTVMVFSMATSLLNLLSILLTGAFIINQLNQGFPDSPFGPPPLFAVAWLLLALPPIAALFSALSLAVAAFARSSKEGQYYLMPLLLITLPLMILPVLPATELDWGTSLIPVTGLMLLLRSLIEGHYAEAACFATPAIAVTVACCLLAIHWAAEQFNNESVLFRESERWDLGVWLRHLVRDRDETPSFGEAILCGVLLLLISFFVSLQVSPPATWRHIATFVVVTQVALIATPALLMTIMLTRNPLRTLRLRAFRPAALPAAFLLALFLHPLAMLLGQGIEALYPLSDDTIRQLEPFLAALREAPLPYVLLLVAALPAVCEELAFRGFILSGLSSRGHKWPAIIISSIFFGVTHGLLQQSLAASAVGVVIGYIAMQSGSLLPGIIYHGTHNSLSILTSRIDPNWMAEQPWLSWLFHSADSPTASYLYTWPVILICAVFSAALLLWFRRLPARSAAHLSLEPSLDGKSASAAAS